MHLQPRVLWIWFAVDGFGLIRQLALLRTIVSEPFAVMVFVAQKLILPLIAHRPSPRLFFAVRHLIDLVGSDMVFFAIVGGCKLLRVLRLLRRHLFIKRLIAPGGAYVTQLGISAAPHVLETHLAD